jgi:hypothetical protein
MNTIREVIDMVGKKVCTGCYWGDRYGMWCGKGQDTDTVTDKCSHYEEGPQPDIVYPVRDSNAWQVGEPIWDVTGGGLLWIDRSMREV